MNHAGFLPSNQRALAVGERHENRGGGEIVIGPRRLRAVRRRGTAAGNVEGIAGRELARPELFPGLQVVGDERVARLRGRLGVGVARGNVDSALLHVDSRGGPNARAGGAPQLYARGVLADRFSGFRDSIGPPNLLARDGVQRDDAAAELAAFVVRHRAGDFLR